MIEIKNLTKSFAGFTALSGLDLSVQKGSIYGLIGTNGAGKTTLIKHMAGILIPDSGQILYDGEPVADNESLKQKIGLIPDELFFPNTITLYNMGKIYSDIYEEWDQQRFEKIISVFKLNGKSKIKSFSKGMKKQAAFALVMATKPEYLLLDEPIDGLDPIVRKLVWKMIVDDVADRQMSVLVSSHNLREMEGICDYIGIISNGKMKIERELDQLRSDMHKVQLSFGKQSCPEAILEELNVIHRETHGSVELLIIKDSRQKVEDIIYAEKPLVFDMLPLSLEEIFIYELGGENDETVKLIF